MKKNDVEALILRWRSAGMITEEQATYMVTDAGVFTSERSGNHFISAIMYMGAAALSLGALLFIASNWSYLPKGMKLLMVLLLPILPLIFAYYSLVVRQSNQVLGRAASIVGVVLIGGSLALIGQMYHLEPDMLAFFGAWACFSFPFVLVFKKKENVLLTAILAGGALFFALYDFLTVDTLDSGVVLLFLTLGGLLYAYLLYVIGVALRHVVPWVESGRLLRVCGAGLALSILFITTFEMYARVIMQTGNNTAFYNQSENWYTLSIALNIFFIAFLIIALLRAVKYEEYGLAFSIVRLFGLYLLVKYFTLFYTMFDTGLFFMVGGVLFIAGGWLLEKNKQTFVKYMKSTHTDTNLIPSR